MAKKHWAQGVKIKAGSLEKLGWPNASAVVAKVTAKNRGLIVGKLNYLANVSADPATKAKAKGAIAKIKAKLGPS